MTTSGGEFDIPHGALSPEMERQPDPLAALHDTLQRSFADPADTADSLEAQRQRLHTVIAAAQEQPLEEHRKGLIDHYGKVVDYLWFGDHTQPLPDALGYYSAGDPRNESWGEIRLRSDVMDATIFTAITHTLTPLGLGELLQERLAYAEQNQAKVLAAYKDVIDATPAAKWLAAFNVENPRTAMPLSPLERAAREAAIREAAERKFGPTIYTIQKLVFDFHRRAGSVVMMPRTVFQEIPLPTPNHGALRLIQRQVQQLDDETSLQQRPRDQGLIALGALRRYVESCIARKREDSRPVAHQIFIPEADRLEEFNADGELIGAYDMNDISSQAAEATALPLAITYGHECVSMDFYLDTFVAVKAGTDSYEAIYNAALAQSYKNLLKSVIDGFNLASARTIGAAFLHAKRVPDNQLFDEPRLHPARWQIMAYEKLKRISHVSQEEHDRERRKLIGIIEKYNDPVPGVSRLLQQKYRREQALPLVPDVDAALILKLEDFWGEPFVPGYELIAADPLQARYYFAYRPGADPYIPNKTPITAEARARLAGEYQQAALPKLAQAVRGTDSLTVSGLAELSQQHSIYTWRPSNSPDLGAMLDDLPSFRIFVKGGRLRATCGVYCLFGKQSFDEWLPSDQTWVTSGYTLNSASDKISGVLHAQVAISASSSGEVTSITEWSAHARGTPPDTHIANPQRKTPDAPAPAVQGQEHIPSSPLSTSQQALKQLLMQLGVIFAPGVAEAIPDDYIFSEVKKLGASHPITVTLRALLHTTDAMKTSSDALTTQQLAECADAFAYIQALRARDHKGSMTAQLDMLENALKPIMQLGLAAH